MAVENTGNEIKTEGKKIETLADFLSEDFIENNVTRKIRIKGSRLEDWDILANPISLKDLEKISNEVDKAGGKGIDGFAKVVLHSLVEPNFASVDMINKVNENIEREREVTGNDNIENVFSGEDVVKKVLTTAEIASLYSSILSISGLNDDFKTSIEKVKNS